MGQSARVWLREKAKKFMQKVMYVSYINIYSSIAAKTPCSVFSQRYNICPHQMHYKRSDEQQSA
jgi:hypothetical protein